MEWRDFFNETSDDSSHRVAAPAPAAEESPPKNGRLTLALAGSILLLFVLVLANVKLIQDPSFTGKSLHSSGCEPVPEWLAPPVKTPLPSEVKSPRTPPEVSFYRDLTVQEDQPSAVPTEARNISPDAGEHAKPTSGVSSTGSKKSETGFHRPAMSGNSSTAVENQEAVLSKLEQQAKAYTVQVGAFTQPGIAQEWAIKWKARGYDVSLKPVARPRSGVIYRLYLGRFASEKEAEDLVQHLKAKEGITAFWLAVR